MERKKMKLAARGRRFGAACIDAVVPVVAYITLMVITGGSRMPGYGYGYGYGYGNEFSYGYEYGSRLTGAAAVIVAAVGMLTVAWAVAEFVFYAKSQSIGKRILGLQVISSIDGKPLGFWKMLFRELIVKSACNVLFLGYIWILIDDKNRGWHDKILDTYVIDLAESERLATRPAAPQTPPYPAPPAKTQPAPPEAEEPEAKAAPPVAPPQAEVMMPEAPAEAEKPAADIEAETVVEPDEEAAKAPAEEKKVIRMSMSMKKEELLAAAREIGVEVDEKATKQEIIDTVKKAVRK